MGRIRTKIRLQFEFQKSMVERKPLTPFELSGHRLGDRHGGAPGLQREPREGLAGPAQTLGSS